MNSLWAIALGAGILLAAILYLVRLGRQAHRARVQQTVLNHVAKADQARDRLDRDPAYRDRVRARYRQ